MGVSPWVKHFLWSLMTLVEIREPTEKSDRARQWQRTPFIPALGRRRQAAPKFEVSLVYRVPPTTHAHPHIHILVGRENTQEEENTRRKCFPQLLKTFLNNISSLQRAIWGSGVKFLCGSNLPNSPRRLGVTAASIRVRKILSWGLECSAALRLHSQRAC